MFYYHFEHVCFTIRASDGDGSLDFIDTYREQEKLRLKQALLSLGFDTHIDALAQYDDLGWQKLVNHGDFERWSKGFAALPDVDVSDVELRHKVRVGDASMSSMPESELTAALQQMHPWRKGPFDVFGVHIDTEWHSDWKWNRVKPHISSLRNRKILDIGCGSGYHLWRMTGEGVKLALGIDPTPLFSLHFATIKRYIPHSPTFLMPMGIDDMPKDMACFDTVFSMGILYHRRSPLDHLYQLKSLLKEGGELVLETLVVDGDETCCLVPEGRYAKMRNVWFIPSVAMLTVWLQRVGFRDVKCADLNTTSIQEQRTTNWMSFESLPDFLDPDDSSKTIEGYQAPQRAVMVASL